jgi:hypothetical protein
LLYMVLLMDSVAQSVIHMICSTMCSLQVDPQILAMEAGVSNKSPTMNIYGKHIQINPNKEI